MAAPRTDIEIAELAGFDMSLTRESLRLSYEERAIQHQAALDLVLELERAAERLRQGLCDPTQPAHPAPLRR